MTAFGEKETVLYEFALYDINTKMFEQMGEFNSMINNSPSNQCQPKRILRKDVNQLVYQLII